MILDLSEFHKDSTRIDGYAMRCKLCRKELDALKRERLKEEFKSGHRKVLEEKKCCRCGEVKKQQEFSVNYTQTTGLNSYCKKCMRELDLERKRRRRIGNNERKSNR